MPPPLAIVQYEVCHLGRQRVGLLDVNNNRVAFEI